jgi:hypothetical protein
MAFENGRLWFTLNMVRGLFLFDLQECTLTHYGSFNETLLEHVGELAIEGNELVANSESPTVRLLIPSAEVFRLRITPAEDLATPPMADLDELEAE